MKTKIDFEALAEALLDKYESDIVEDFEEQYLDYTDPRITPNVYEEIDIEAEDGLYPSVGMRIACEPDYDSTEEGDPCEPEYRVYRINGIAWLDVEYLGILKGEDDYDELGEEERELLNKEISKELKRRAA